MPRGCPGCGVCAEYCRVVAHSQCTGRCYCTATTYGYTSDSIDSWSHDMLGSTFFEGSVLLGLELFTSLLCFRFTGRKRRVMAYRHPPYRSACIEQLCQRGTTTLTSLPTSSCWALRRSCLQPIPAARLRSSFSLLPPKLFPTPPWSCSQCPQAIRTHDRALLGAVDNTRPPTRCAPT
jgi:hypothetical protein